MDLPALTVDDPQHWTRWLAGSPTLAEACARWGITVELPREAIDAAYRYATGQTDAMPDLNDPRM